MRTPARFILAGIAALVIASVFTTSRAAAQDCPAFDAGDPGKRFPVILIHGFNGDRSAMVPTRDALVGAGLDVHIVDFEYPCAKTEWVENPNIGLRLQNAIKELADKSMANGGPGRVAVIGHSMGGLATRQALTGGDLDGRVAFLATYGTPHTGSTVARLLDADTWDAKVVKFNVQQIVGVPLDSNAGKALQAFSEQINRLQPISGTYPVLSTAGDYLVTERLGNWVRNEVSYGDMVVDLPSALSQSVASGGLGGQATTTCEIAMPVVRRDNRWEDIRNAVFNHSYANRPDLASCFHNNLMKDPNLQRITVEQMRAVIDRTKARRPPKPKEDPRQSTVPGGSNSPRRGKDFKATIVEFMVRKANGLDTGDLGNEDAATEAVQAFAEFAAYSGYDLLGKDVGWTAPQGVRDCDDAGDISTECLVFLDGPVGDESPVAFKVTTRAFGDDDPVDFCDGSLCNANGDLADPSSFRAQVVGVAWFPIAPTP